MKKKLLELLNKKQSIVNRMKSTNEAGDTAGFAAAQMPQPFPPPSASRSASETLSR